MAVVLVGHLCSSAKSTGTIGTALFPRFENDISVRKRVSGKQIEVMTNEAGAGPHSCVPQIENENSKNIELNMLGAHVEGIGPDTDVFCSHNKTNGCNDNDVPPRAPHAAGSVPASCGLAANETYDNIGKAPMNSGNVPLRSFE